MRYPLTVEGFEGRQLEVESRLFGRPRLWLDGETPPRGPKRGHFLLRRDDGSELVVQLKPAMMDTLPKVFIDGEPYHLARPLAWYEMLWAGIPLLLYLFGGILGSLLGVAGALVNRNLLRSERGAVARYTLTGGVTLLCFVLQLSLATLAELLLRRLRIR
jgi:hypothetical protein